MKSLLQAILAFSILLIILQFFQDELVFNRTNITLEQWYRVFTGNLVHSNYPHLLLNLSGLWIAGFLFLDSMNVKTFIISTIFLCIVVGLGLYFFSLELEKYYGFSGALYGLFIFGATTIIIHQQDYITGLLLYLFVGGKIIWDQFNGENSSSADLIGVPVAIDAHLYGAIGAVILSTGYYLLVKNKTHSNKL